MIGVASTCTWVSLSGSAEVVRDVAKAKELWNSWVEAWLPQGPEDDNVALIRFTSESAEYWDTPGGRVASIVSFAKAKLTGERTNLGENETVDMPQG